MVKAKKKICLLLAGGTWTTDKAKNMLAVNHEENIEPWLGTMPELSILSDLDVHIFATEEDLVDLKIWASLAAFVFQNHEKYDGFVVVTKAEKMVLTAVALNFLLQNFKKTIVVTGSQMSGVYTREKKDLMQRLLNDHGGLSLRSNLINAVQMAGEFLPQVAVMLGSRLAAGVKARVDYQQGKYILSSIDDDYLARVDFGISFKSNLAYPKAKEEIFQKLSDQVCVLQQQNSHQFLWPKESWSEYKAILIFLQDESLSVEERNYLRALKKPIILYHPLYLQTETEFMTLTGCTAEVAMIKVMWLIKNLPLDTWPKFIKSSIIDEFVNF